MNNTQKHSKKRMIAPRQKLWRTASLLVPLCFFALFLASLLLSFVNDIYAFVRPSKEASITLNSTQTYELAQILEENGIILNPVAFTLYAKQKGCDELIYSFSGTLSLDSTMSYREILKTLK